MSLEKPKLVVVTGASKGLGKAISELLIQQSSYYVLGVARNSSLLTELKQSLGERFSYVIGDLNNLGTQIKVKETCEKFSLLGLVNNVGGIEPIAKYETVDMESFKRLFETNLFSVISLTQHLLPQLLETKGNLINISSGASTSHYHGWGAYCCTKAALNMFSQGLALENPKIQVLCLRPGVLDTDMQLTIRTLGEENMKEDQFQKFVQLKQTDQLVHPKVPAQVIINLLHKGIPKHLSGQYLNYLDEQLN